MKSLCELILVACLMITFSASPVEVEPTLARGDQLIIWNVGQGLWATWVTHDGCHHFDAGGERAPWKALSQICLHRENILHFSHWDSDHIGFVTKIQKRFPMTCVYSMPAGNGSPRKTAMFARLPACIFKAKSQFAIEEKLARELIENPRTIPAATMGSNDVSRVYVLKNRALLPGDSPIAAEKYWSHQLSDVEKRLPLLILGHHGSKTATSQALLSQLVNLKQAVASARKARYGHPHLDVVARLTQKGVATLNTEDWGSIYFEWP